MIKRYLLGGLICILLFSCASFKTVEKESSTGNINPLTTIVRLYPSCSEYSLQCFKKHGAFIGYMMTCDRLMRCGRDELYLSPGIIVDGKLKCRDPVENNDFWWSD
ncbi:MAG: hypothetical protein B1H13_07225 [Desulfobacteraceae bacterium 4484_190.3]|nr:MAG: hypothetical protein B1H13_07225 [Desulfobacteraceae bacterium 4484_190.3]